MIDKDKPQNKVLIIFALLIILLVIYNIYMGFTIKKIGIPPIFEIEFEKSTPTSTVTSTPTVTSTLAVTSTPSPSPSPTYKIMNCFPEVPESRTKVMEAGTEEFLLVGRFEPKNEPVVIMFTEYNNPIGSIKLFFFPDNLITKIEKVVDPKCQQIEEFSHIDDGSKDKYVLQDYDWIKIKFENKNYLLMVYYQVDEIKAEFLSTV